MGTDIDNSLFKYRVSYRHTFISSADVSAVARVGLVFKIQKRAGVKSIQVKFSSCFGWWVGWAKID